MDTTVRYNGKESACGRAGSVTARGRAGEESARGRAGSVTALFIAAVLQASCGGGDTFVLTVYNTLESTEAIRVDLAGDTRELPVGAFTEFRSVKAGSQILSVESSTCSGVVRNTVEVTADTVVRYRAERDGETGACEISPQVEAFRSVAPTGS